MVNKFKKASKLKLRFTTSKGLLSIEQLWDLSINDLDTLAISLKDQYDTSSSKSFVVTRSSKNKTLKLKFDIVLDILNSKVEEQNKIIIARENKAHNDKIYAAIAELEDNELKSMSKKELLAQIK